MSTVWVTGIAGFLGSNVARRFQTAGWIVAGIGRMRATPGFVAATGVSHVMGSPALVEGEITPASLAALADRVGVPDVVVHAAGAGAVAPSFRDPFEDFQNTVGATAVLLEALRCSAPEARLVLPSSAAVYGLQPDGPIAEDAPPQPVSPYGAHKLAAEIICRQAQLNFGQPVAVLRFFSLYGPQLRKQLLWDLSRRLQPHPARLDLSGTGQETRDLLFIDDAVELVWAAAHAQSGWVLLNGGTGEPSTVRQIAEGLVRRLAPSTAIRFDGQVRPGDPKHLYCDAAALHDFGFRPQVTLDQGLDRYVDWLSSSELAA